MQDILVHKHRPNYRAHRVIVIMQLVSSGAKTLKKTVAEQKQQTKGRLTWGSHGLTSHGLTWAVSISGEGGLRGQ